MKREIIIFTDAQLKYFPDETIKGYSLVNSKIIKFDSEKGYTTDVHVIKRLLDDKFFEVTVKDWGQGEREVENKAIEVFRKEKITYTYE